MKSLFKTFPNISRFLLAFLLFGSAFIISGLIDNPFLKQYFPYSASILLLLATCLLFRMDKKSLSAIGLNFKLRNLSFLPFGVIIGAMAFLGAKYIRCLYTGESFVIGSTIDYSLILYALYTILPTVAVEEFIFRGYLFKKTIGLTNVVIANVIFSILFMLVHVLDENIIQNKALVLFMTITIPIGHLLFATALIKSKTLFFPIGIHLGNNWATRHLISNFDNGDSLLYIPNQASFDTWADFIGLIVIWNGFFLVVTLILWKWDQIFLFAKPKRRK